MVLHRKKKGPSIRTVAVASIIFLWLILFHIFLFLGNQITENMSRTQSVQEFSSSEHISSCEDLRLRFASNGVCYNAIGDSVVVSFHSIGRANVSSVMINVIGNDGMVMSIENIEPDNVQPHSHRVDYDFDENGLVDLVEVVPSLIVNGLEVHCEQSKIVTRKALTC